jgi:hypothetical protein
VSIYVLGECVNVKVGVYVCELVHM